MVKVETLKEDGFVRILRCREDNSWVPLNTRSQNFLVFKGEYGSVKFNIYK